MLTYAYLDHRLIRKTNGEPRLPNFKYYRQIDSDTAIWDEDDPLILKPWLSLRFGQRMPRVRIGAGSTIVKPFQNSINELGLLYYQLASANVIDYSIGATAVFRRARIQAFSDLHSVSHTLGAGFLDIVRSCLQYDPIDKTPPVAKSSSTEPLNELRGREHFKEGKDNEETFLEKLIDALRVCEKNLEFCTEFPAFATVGELDGGEVPEMTTDMDCESTNASKGASNIDQIEERTETMKISSDFYPPELYRHASERSSSLDPTPLTEREPSDPIVETLLENNLTIAEPGNSHNVLDDEISSEEACAGQGKHRAADEQLGTEKSPPHTVVAN